MVFIGLIILLLVSLLGSRLQGISLSMLGGLGVCFFVVMLRVTPAEPPCAVVLCIASVLALVGAVESAGGISYLVQLAETFIRKYPHRIVYISPIVTYIITFLGGTNHIAYSILPVIAEVSREVGIRPERPLSLSVIAALHGALCSPISSIMVAISGFLHLSGIDMIMICKILIPSTIGGLSIATFVISRLDQTIPNHERGSTPLIPFNNGMPTAKNCHHVGPLNGSTKAKLSVVLFLMGSVLVVLLSAFKSLRPSWEENGIKVFLQDEALLPLVMLSTAAVVMLLCRISTKSIIQGKAFLAGVQGMFSLFGIAWLSSTFVQTNKSTLLNFISSYLSAPWQFAFILLLMSAIMGSSAATVKAIFPLGIALGIPPKILLASAVAVNGVFIIPIYPTILAAINLDTTGTTRIGKFLFNHSFMLPGLLTVVGTLSFAFFFVYIGMSD